MNDCISKSAVFRVAFSGWRNHPRRPGQGEPSPGRYERQGGRVGQPPHPSVDHDSDTSRRNCGLLSDLDSPSLHCRILCRHLVIAAEDGMGAKIEITRLELSAAQLRRLASRSQDGRLACRILAIALVLEGWSRAEAAAACGMDRQTLRDWVHGYNHEGIGGLSDARRSGRPPALSAEQMQDLKNLVLAGARPGDPWGHSLALSRPVCRDRRLLWGRRA
jgi:hypothetical protein